MHTTTAREQLYTTVVPGTRHTGHVVQKTKRGEKGRCYLGVERRIAGWVTERRNKNTFRESTQHTATLTSRHSRYKTIPRAYKGPMALQKNKVTPQAPRG